MTHECHIENLIRRRTLFICTELFLTQTVKRTGDVLVRRNSRT